MLAPALYQVPQRKTRRKAKKDEGGLHSKGILDATSVETQAPSSEEEGEEEGDIPSPLGRKRTASADLEAEASKRGKISLSDGSGSEADVVPKYLRKDKPFAES